MDVHLSVCSRCNVLKLNITCLLVFFLSRYRFDMSVEEAAELARRAIYHATFRDGASGGVVSGKSKFLYPSSRYIHLLRLQNFLFS